jgi:predicted anti-sigma-YlaC factor YlaD
MLTCKQTSELISQSLDKPQTWKTRFDLKLHLMMCKACQQYAKQMHTIKSNIFKLRESIQSDESITLSEEAKKRMIDKLNQK